MVGIEKNARHYAELILRATNQAEHDAACAQVPEHLRPTVRRLVQIGKAIRDHSKRVAPGGGRLK